MLTETLITVPRTVTAPCSGATRTVTVYPQGSTVVVTSTAIRTATDGQVTSYWTTTVSATATCHYPLSWFFPRHWTDDRGDADPTATATENRDVAATAATAAVAAVAAVTSTYTQTTYTVTSTSITTVPARTTTELGESPGKYNHVCQPADPELVIKTTTATV